MSIAGTRHSVKRPRDRWAKSSVEQGQGQWTYDRQILEVRGVRWAGESALARLSMLNEPQQQVLAMAAEAEQRARQTGIFFEPRTIADGIAVQVWRYEPGMQAKKITVDPLSLWLSLEVNPDDRIQMALDEIEEKFPW